MDFQQLVTSAFEAFSGYEKPAHSTNHQHCGECAEYDELLSEILRQDLSIEQIGTDCWGPISFLTPEAMAYYMPRLIELAASGVDGKDRDPYYIQFINSVSAGPSDRQYGLFGLAQNKAVACGLSFIKENYYEGICAHCWEDELEKSLIDWSRR
ncbi:hypothetical protein GCM10027046_28800 [Uliginosibacterium flavum]|uniref:Uncharacterized protein n=1 Tax=Uliginosibacterium flavum TaxID=1396831 RepID=A0ABV2TGQ7_9RHOO